MTLLISSPKDISTIRSVQMLGAIAAMVRADAKAKQQTMPENSEATGCFA